MKYIYSLALAATVAIASLTTPATSEAGPIRRALWGGGYYNTPYYGSYYNAGYGNSWVPSVGYYDSSYYVAPSTSYYYPAATSYYYPAATSYYYPATSYYYNPGGGIYYDAGVEVRRPLLRTGAAISGAVLPWNWR